MAFVLLFYNILLTSILAMSVAGAYYLYVREGRRVFAALGVMFAVYLLDNTVVFATESIEAFAVAYDQMFISSPAFKTIYFYSDGLSALCVLQHYAAPVACPLLCDHRSVCGADDMRAADNR